MGITLLMEEIPNNHLGFIKPCTLPETNIALKIDPWKRRFLLETTIFRAMLVSGRVNNGINYQPQLVNAGFLNHQQ